MSVAPSKVPDMKLVVGVKLRRNRASQARFACRSCGVVAHADRNASRNIARKGADAWNTPREPRVPIPDT
ncbi:zinc ribbon domain-containing protein [Streptacidiphilus jeojiensis]|uniref:zinc ribbon domain-containing protein n=1 Tax=Streptacidiphilus jeojiensis TaxID=3229225 RepID=UPI0036D3C075